MNGGSEREGALVIGEALTDVVRTREGSTEVPGGSPANVALGLGRLGLPVRLLTSLARDRRGADIERHLRDSGVEFLDESFMVQRTATAVATIDEAGRADYEFDIEWRLPENVDIGRPALVHTGSIAAFLAPGAARVRQIIETAGAAEVTFDPNIRPALLGDPAEVRTLFERMASLSTVVKLSDEDAAWLYPGSAAGDVLQRILALGPRLAAVTLGEHGSVLATEEHDVRVPPVPVEPVDSIGAGDTFMASLIVSILETGSQHLDRAALEAIGTRAGRAAAITVSRAGADLPWSRELPR